MAGSRRVRRRHRYLTLADLEYISDIDSGSYSNVSLYRLKNNRDKRYAVKAIEGNGNNGLICLSEFFILKNIVNSGIIGYRGYQIVNNTLYIILEKAEATLLGHCKDNFSKNGREKEIPDDLMSKWIHQIASALCILHHENIVHCDVKSDNILMFSDGNVKLSDFGMSSLDNSGPHLTNATSFRAPEIWRDMIVRKSIDMWSLGCVLYDLRYGGSPFRQAPRRDKSRRSDERRRERALDCIKRWGYIRRKMLDGTYNYHKDVASFSPRGYTPPSISSAFDPSTPLSKLILNLLNPDPAERATAVNVLDDPYLEHIQDKQIDVQYKVPPFTLDGYNEKHVEKLMNGYSSNNMTKNLATHFVKQMWTRRMEIKDNMTINELVDIGFFIAFKILRSSNIDSHRFLLSKAELSYYEKRVLTLKIPLDLLYHVKR